MDDIPGEYHIYFLGPGISFRMLTIDLRSPGRWFAAHAMKLIIGYILVNYDIEPLNKRPANSIIGQTIIPPLHVPIRIRPRR